MKYIITAIIIFLTLMIASELNYRQKCEQQGGVVVEAQPSANCWKDNGFININ